MTAEIAILNKAAVALAADSAVTISAGSTEEKIFDSADKLFELSCCDPIGVMVYNDLSFMEIPIASLIKQYRKKALKFKSVEDAAYDFLRYLNEVARESPKEIKHKSITTIVSSLLDAIKKRYDKKVKDYFEAGLPENFTVELFDQKIVEFMGEVIGVFERIVSGQSDAEFIGKGPLSIEGEAVNILIKLVEDYIPQASPEHKAQALELCRVLLKKSLFSSNFTGIVVAGFGSDELFPTLISFQIDGVVCNRLRYSCVDHVDIARSGPRARVLPFAQKEMVERFLYGLDSAIQNNISSFCSNNIGSIKSALLEGIEFPSDDARQVFDDRVNDAENVFLSGLREKAFESIRSQSQSEIEDMVEFMPKPELAKMAEALVNLTSIKRRVSRGMETVGGPIDVAVISQSEGFIWVKRKHYFSAEINQRYINRMRGEVSDRGEGVAHGPEQQIASPPTRVRRKNQQKA